MTLILGITPVFAVIVLGFLFRVGRIVPEAFWPAAEHITFYVFFPALLFATTAAANLAGIGAGGLAATVAASILIVTALIVALSRAMRLDGPTFSSLVQAGIRPNVYVAIATATALAGDEGLAAVSLCVAVAVPLVNFISVVALVHGARCSRVRVRPADLVLSVLANPLILASLGGLAVNLADLRLPEVVGSLLKILSPAALPLGLLAVGAGLDLGAARRGGSMVLLACGVKLVLLPTVTLGLCEILMVGGLARLIAVMFAALPIAASAFVMARKMGGNAPFLAAAITLSTLASAVTMPVIVALLS